MLGGDIPQAPRRPSIERIKRSVALHYRIGLEKLEGESRLAEYAHPRQEAMYLARRLITEPSHRGGDVRIPMSFPRIGRAFDRDHTTALLAWRQVQHRIHADPETQRNVAAIIDVLLPFAETEAT